MLLTILLQNSQGVCSEASVILPPPPGPQNDKTLWGIDSNKNGVRDDVEIFIYKNISRDPTIYKSYLYFAQSLQESLKFPDDIEKLRENDERSFNDQMCVLIVDKNWEKERITAKARIIKVMFNTREREEVSESIGEKYHKFGKARVHKEHKKKDVCRF